MSEKFSMSGVRAMKKWPMTPDNWILVRGKGDAKELFALSCKHADAWLGYVSEKSCREYLAQGFTISSLENVPVPPRDGMKQEEFWPNGLARGRREPGSSGETRASAAKVAGPTANSPPIRTLSSP